MFSTLISGPVAVIGDVHGQTDKLAVLLGQLAQRPDFDDRWIVFLGDLVDRGRDPRGAVEAVASLVREGRKVTAVAGNHELAMAGALGLVPAPEYANWRTRWLAGFGAEATFSSYGAPFEDCETLASVLPESHRELLARLPWCVSHDDYFFVHAGLDPQLPFRSQKAILEQRDFSLSSPGWLFSKRWAFEPSPPGCDKVIVAGHVPVPQVQMSAQRILVDTTGGVGGDLSCVLLPERTVLTSAGSEALPGGPLKRPKFFGRRAAPV